MNDILMNKMAFKAYKYNFTLVKKIINAKYGEGLFKDDEMDFFASILKNEPKLIPYTIQNLESQMIGMDRRMSDEIF